MTDDEERTLEYVKTRGAEELYHRSDSATKVLMWPWPMKDLETSESLDAFYQLRSFGWDIRHYFWA